MSLPPASAGIEAPHIGWSVYGGGGGRGAAPAPPLAESVLHTPFHRPPHPHTVRDAHTPHGHAPTRHVGDLVPSPFHHLHYGPLVPATVSAQAAASAAAAESVARHISQNAAVPPPPCVPQTCPPQQASAPACPAPQSCGTQAPVPACPAPPPTQGSRQRTDYAIVNEYRDPQTGKLMQVLMPCVFVDAEDVKRAARREASLADPQAAMEAAWLRGKAMLGTGGGRGGPRARATDRTFEDTLARMDALKSMPAAAHDTREERAAAAAEEIVAVSNIMTRASQAAAKRAAAAAVLRMEQRTTTESQRGTVAPKDASEFEQRGLTREADASVLRQVNRVKERVGGSEECVATSAGNAMAARSAPCEAGAVQALASREYARHAAATGNAAAAAAWDPLANGGPPVSPRALAARALAGAVAAATNGTASGVLSAAAPTFVARTVAQVEGAAHAADVVAHTHASQYLSTGAGEANGGAARVSGARVAATEGVRAPFIADATRVTAAMHDASGVATGERVPAMDDITGWAIEAAAAPRFIAGGGRQAGSAATDAAGVTADITRDAHLAPPTHAVSASIQAFPTRVSYAPQDADADVAAGWWATALHSAAVDAATAAGGGGGDASLHASLPPATHYLTHMVRAAADADAEFPRAHNEAGTRAARQAALVTAAPQHAAALGAAHAAPVLAARGQEAAAAAVAAAGGDVTDAVRATVAAREQAAAADALARTVGMRLIHALPRPDADGRGGGGGGGGGVSPLYSALAAHVAACGEEAAALAMGRTLLGAVLARTAHTRASGVADAARAPRDAAVTQAAVTHSALLTAQQPLGRDTYTEDARARERMHARAVIAEGVSSGGEAGGHRLPAASAATWTAATSAAAAHARDTFDPDVAAAAADAATMTHVRTTVERAAAERGGAWSETEAASTRVDAALRGEGRAGGSAAAFLTTHARPEEQALARVTAAGSADATQRLHATAGALRLCKAGGAAEACVDAVLRGSGGVLPPSAALFPPHAQLAHAVAAAGTDAARTRVHADVHTHALRHEGYAATASAVNAATAHNASAPDLSFVDAAAPAAGERHAERARADAYAGAGIGHAAGGALGTTRDATTRGAGFAATQQRVDAAEAEVAAARARVGAAVEAHVQGGRTAGTASVAAHEEARTAVRTAVAGGVGASAGTRVNEVLATSSAAERDAVNASSAATSHALRTSEAAGGSAATVLALDARTSAQRDAGAASANNLPRPDATDAGGRARAAARMHDLAIEAEVAGRAGAAALPACLRDMATAATGSSAGTAALPPALVDALLRDGVARAALTAAMEATARALTPTAASHAAAAHRAAAAAAAAPHIAASGAERVADAVRTQYAQGAHASRVTENEALRSVAAALHAPLAAWVASDASQHAPTALAQRAAITADSSSAAAGQAAVIEAAARGTLRGVPASHSGAPLASLQPSTFDARLAGWGDARAPPASPATDARIRSAVDAAVRTAATSAYASNAPPPVARDLVRDHELRMSASQSAHLAAATAAAGGGTRAGVVNASQFHARMVAGGGDARDHVLLAHSMHDAGRSAAASVAARDAAPMGGGASPVSLRTAGMLGAQRAAAATRDAREATQNTGFMGWTLGTKTVRASAVHPGVAAMMGTTAGSGGSGGGTPPPAHAFHVVPPPPSFASFSERAASRAAEVGLSNAAAAALTPRMTTPHAVARDIDSDARARGNAAHMGVARLHSRIPVADV